MCLLQATPHTHKHKKRAQICTYTKDYVFLESLVHHSESSGFASPWFIGAILAPDQ